MDEYQAPAAVDLTDEEKALVGRIKWDLPLEDRDACKGILEAAGELAKSLLRRKTVPQARLEYFTDPGMNIGRGKKSRKEVFEENGTEGEDIFRHPHFLKYLRYFISGPDLPPSTVSGFCDILNEDAGTSGEVMDQLTKFVRSEVRTHGLEGPVAAEEFFKLAHELGLDDLLRRVVRDAARTTK